MKLKKIVAATDFSEASKIALDTAVRLAAESGATLYLIHVVELPTGVDPMVGFVEPPTTTGREKAMKQLRALISRKKLDGIRVEAAALAGHPAEEIADFARVNRADIIVVGTHGRSGIGRLFMGSTAESLLRKAPCQVLVVKQKARTGKAAVRQA